MRLLLVIILLSVTAISNQSLAQNSYKEANPDTLSEILQPTGQKKVLLVYASWCPHCQIIFPELVEIEKNNPGSVQAISMDSDMNRFKRFLQKFPDSSIEPLVWNKEFHLGFSLQKRGVNFEGFIPFVALIDKDGKIVKEGHVTHDEVKMFLK